MGKMFLSAMIILSTACTSRVKPQLGILPDFDKPLCTEKELVSLGLDECSRRLLAFIGRGVQSVVVLRSVTTTKRVETSEVKGTGIIMDAHGRVLTAYSTVHDVPKIVALVRTAGGADGRLLYDEVRKVPMRIKSYSKRLNIAFLEPEEPQSFPRPFVVDPSVRWFEPEEKLWFFGSPTLFSSGFVVEDDSGSRESTLDLFEVGIPVSGADLGGGVVAPDGRIVGIVVGPGVEKKTSYIVPISTPVQLFDIQTAVAAAVQDIGTELDGYLAAGELTEAGMCDQMRTTIYRIEASSGITVSGIIPATNDQFVDVKIDSDGKESHRYFIKRRAVDGEAPVVQELQGMEWGLSLRRESPNAYHFHYRLKSNDCSMQKIEAE